VPEGPPSRGTESRSHSKTWVTKVTTSRCHDVITWWGLRCLSSPSSCLDRPVPEVPTVSDAHGAMGHRPLPHVTGAPRPGTTRGASDTSVETSERTGVSVPRSRAFDATGCRVHDGGGNGLLLMIAEGKTGRQRCQQRRCDGISFVVAFLAHGTTTAAVLDLENQFLSRRHERHQFDGEHLLGF